MAQWRTGFSSPSAAPTILGWQLAEQTAVDCLEARRALWDGICE